MSYEIRTAIVNPEEGYNNLAKTYHQYHKHLNSFENGMFLRFLPRDLEWMSVLDIGAGDGRMYSFFEKKKLGKFVACDIAQDLLAQHPVGIEIEKIVCNLEDKLHWKDEVFDIVTSFFVIEYIENLQQLFEETYRVLKPGGRFIIGHFLQRRAFVFKVKDQKFKIDRHNWRKDDIEELVKNNMFQMHAQEIMENGTLLGYVFVCVKPE